MLVDLSPTAIGNNGAKLVSVTQERNTFDNLPHCALCRARDDSKMHLSSVIDQLESAPRDPHYDPYFFTT